MLRVGTVWARCQQVCHDNHVTVRNPSCIDPFAKLMESNLSTFVHSTHTYTSSPHVDMALTSSSLIWRTGSPACAECFMWLTLVHQLCTLKYCWTGKCPQLIDFFYPTYLHSLYLWIYMKFTILLYVFLLVLSSTLLNFHDLVADPSTIWWKGECCKGSYNEC